MIMDKEKLKNDNLEAKKAMISALFDELISQVEKEIKDCFNLPKKWSMSRLAPHFDFHKASKDEILNIQLEYGIKFKSGKIVRWNPEYKKEALNESFLWVLPYVKGVALDLKTEIFEKFDENSTLKTIKFITKKIKFYHKLKSSSEGKSYYHEDYRNSVNNLNKNRFDVIWDCNEIFHVFPLMKRKGNPINYAMSSDYPFVDIDMQQWIDFERAYRMLPLLKKSLHILNNESTDKNNQPKLPPLEQVIFIETLRQDVSGFNSFSNDKKLSFLNLITKGQNHDENKQLKALEDIINLDEDDYGKLEDNYSDWARYIKEISNSNLANLRGKISEYNRKYIKKENDKNNQLLSDKEKEYNKKTQKIIENIKKKQLKIDGLIKSIE